MPAFAYFVVIALLREADGGGQSSYGALAMLPVFWLALYGTRDQLAVSIAGVAAVFVTPLLLVGAPEYPASEWTRAMLWICVAPIIGFTVQSLVSQLRRSAAENLRRADELQVSQEETRKLVVSMAAVTEATRELARTTDSKVAREVICSAACTITGARFAKLMERSPDGDLVMSANYGLQGAPPLRVSLADETSGAGTAFLNKKPMFFADVRGDDQVNQRVVQATGRRVDALRARCFGTRSPSRCSSSAGTARSTARDASPRRCACSPPRPRWRSSAPTCSLGSRRSRAPTT